MSLENTEPLNLQAAIGFKGGVNGGVILHPDNVHLIYIIGSTVVVRNVLDKSQHFLEGHDNDVSALAVSRCGRYVASGQKALMGFNADVILWDFSSLKSIHRLSLHKSGVTALAFSHDSLFLASLGCQDDNRLAVWDVSKGSTVGAASAASDTALCVSFFNQSSRYLITGGHLHIRLWLVDAENRKLRPTPVNTGTIKRVITAALMSPDDKLAYCGSSTGDIIEIDVERALYRRFGPPKTPFSKGIAVIKALPDGDILIGAGDGTIAKLHAASLRVVRQCEVLGGVTSLALTNDGTHVFCGTSLCNLYWVNVDSLTAELRNTCHSTPINSVFFPFGYSEVFATAASQDVRVWNAKTKQEVLRIQVPGLDCLCGAFARDGKSILTGWSDGKVRAFLPQSGKLLYVINDAHKNGVTALAATADGCRLVTGGMEGEVRIWRIGKGSHSMEISLKEHRGRVWSLKLSKDSHKAVSASADGSVIVWDLQNKSRTLCLFESTMFKSAIYSPDESQLVTTGSDRKVAFWDVFDGEGIRTLEGALEEEINTLAVSQSGSHFLTAGADGLLRVWDYDAGLCKFVGRAHSGAIMSAKFSPDQKTIVSVGTEGAVFVWTLPQSVADKCSEK